jgi:hypothetical protein
MLITSQLFEADFPTKRPQFNANGGKSDFVEAR